MNSIKDSKKMSAKQRALAVDFIKKHAQGWAIATVDNHEIDRINILQATYKAMHSALDGITCHFDKIAVDGNKFKSYKDKPYVCVVGGDNKLFQIAAASILAKEYRDGEILRLVQEKPELGIYKLDKNKGYGTKEHMNAIREHGITEHHRKTFIHI
jgi:ribonuclease HII